MSWARERQAIILTILGVIVFGILVLIGVKLFVKAPSCMDGKQDGKEEGIDCGGPCPYLCSVSEAPLQVQFVRAVNPAPGRTDTIAYVDNANANAGIEHAEYSLDVYGPSQDLLAHKIGTISVPPSTTVPLYIPRVYEGSESVSQSFITFSSSSLQWLRASAKPVVPIPSSIQIQEGQSPRVTATLQNTLPTPLYNATFVATVFDTSGNAIDASQTVVGTLPAQGNASVIFTWNQPFPSVPARVEILPAYGP